MADARLLVVLAILILQILCFTSHEVSAATSTSCHPSGFLRGKGELCSELDTCCVAGKRYPQFKCSPPVSAKTPAIMTLTTFNGEDDAAAIRKTRCNQRVLQDTDPLVALSSGWFRLDGTNRCNMNISISSANGRSVVAQVVDECDSVNGCDEDHGFAPPCRKNVLNASFGVFRALRLDETSGDFKVTWSDVYSGV